jgi:transposase InsO family protein
VPAPHPPEFRQRAVDLARSKVKPIAEIGKELSISESCLRKRTELVSDALGMAITRRRPERQATILHSDHGSQGGFNQSSQH